MTQNFLQDIVGAIADTKIESTELDLILAEHINVSVLSHLTAHNNSSWELTFEISDYDVTVRSDGSIIVDGEQGQSWMAA